MIISKIYNLGLLVLLLTACDSADNSARDRPAPPVHQVEVVSASIKAVSHQQTVSGTLEAITSVRLYNEESGRITKLPYHEGDSVNQGDTVIILDGSLIQAELDKAKAEYKQAKADLRRLKKLVDKKLASDEVLAHSRTTLDVARAEEQLQRTRFQRTIIRAPFSGIITERYNETGDIVVSHSLILTLIDPTTLLVKIQVGERWIPLIHIDDKVKVRIDALGEQLHNGSITRIHPTVNPNTRKGIVEITLQPVPDNATAGQLARAELVTQPAERLVIPTRAIRHDSNGAYVFLIIAEQTGETKTKKVTFEKGLTFGDMTEVVSGISAGDDIVTKGFLGLSDNQAVQISTSQ